jgi:Mechanosensitive ion channel
VKPSTRMATCCAILAVTMAGGLSVDTVPSPYQLPSNSQVIGYLLQSIGWYRHVYAERQVADEPADLIFLNDNQAIEAQIVKLSFEFGKADAALARTTSVPDSPSVTSPDAVPSDLAHFIDLKNRNDQASQQTLQDIDKLRESIAAARGADRKKLEAALDDAQSRLERLQAVSQAINDLIDFAQNIGTEEARTAKLDLTIDDLAQSMPELNNPATPVSRLPAQDANSRTSNGWRESGILGLASEVSALNRKLRVVDEKIRLTDGLAVCTKDLRAPMSGFITRVLQSDATSDPQTRELSSLREQKSQLDALTVTLKAFSPAVVALDKQKALLAEYKSHLVPWRTEVAGQYREAWKKLLVRLVTVVLIIGLLTGTGEISRGLALRRVQDPNRHLIISMVHRVVTLISITVVALFGASSDLKSLATYFGLLTAGMAVALQNVIVASLGYLLLIGKRGIKIGDRVQVAAITGDVIDMGLLQFQLREFDVLKQQFTGQVATFSNSLVFVSGTGLLKFTSAAEKVAHTVADRTGIEPDSAEHGSLSPGARSSE